MLLPAIGLLAGCGMDEFSDEEEDEGTLVAVVPTGHGEGTQKRPFTPNDLLEGGDLPYGEEVWVMGYAVGSTIESMDEAWFDVPTDYEHNILLSNDSLSTDPTECIPVELSTADMQLRYSLALQPSNFRHFIVIRGTLDSYFSQAGIRRSDAAYWIDGFDIRRVYPQEWDVLDKEF